MRILKFVTQYWLFILLAALAIGLSALSFLNEKTEPQKTPSSPPQVSNQWQGIKPGITTRQEFEQKFPDFSRVNQTEYRLPSESNVRPHELILLNERVELIKRQLITPESLSNLLVAQGQEEARLYGEHSAAGFLYYAFAQKGILVVGNPGIDEVIEIWYFNPVALDVFLSTWGKELTRERPENF